MKNKISVLHAIADIHSRSGGTSRVVVDLADALSDQAFGEIVLIAQSIVGEPTVRSERNNVHRVIENSFPGYKFKFGLSLRDTLRGVIQDYSISLIHSHGLWLPVNHWVCQRAQRSGIPLVIQPHGMLEPWALNFKAWKKRAAMFFFQRRDLESAVVLIATSLRECENIRKLGFRQPIAVIPNGVKKRDFISSLASTSASGPRRLRTVLFLSRVHPIKGLVNLIKAWAELAPLGWRLIIAGPDEAGHLQEIMHLIRELDLYSSIEYVGEVSGEQKSNLFTTADIFVLPTFTENFGLVVAEALAHGLPVITTKGAPWSELQDHGCGWWIDIGVAPLVLALREAIAMSDEERKLMGIRGKEYVRRYDWDDIARQTTAVYRWILRQGHKPDCIVDE